MCVVSAGKNHQKADGIMGLSRQSNTIVTALHNAHKLPQYVFTLCLRYVLLVCGIAVCKCWLLTVVELGCWRAVRRAGSLLLAASMRPCTLHPPSTQTC